MPDIVNDYFHKHYPPNLDRELFEPEWCGPSCGQSYKGPDRSARIFPSMVCADGFSMSVQGHFGAYSYPRDDFAERYETVEVYEVSAPDPILNEWETAHKQRIGLAKTANRAGMDEPMAYVPIAVIERVIAAHGGLVA